MMGSPSGSQNNARSDHSKYPGCRCSPRKDGGVGRNLVVCIDGTANRFSQDLKFTNVIRLYNLAEKNATQLTFYNSGIGTYARPSRYSFKRLAQFCYHAFNQAVAWDFEPIILDAYRWLPDNYEEGDRIFLFGFSRGAYQVRVLSAMIDRVGLIHKGNTKQIPFVYELYEGLKDTCYDKPSSASDSLPPATPGFHSKATTCGKDASQNEILETPSTSGIDTPSREKASELPYKPRTDESAQKEDMRPSSKSRTDDSVASKAPEIVFKKAFCREANIHFVGVWDTVSSIGFIRRESHPDATSGMRHVCYFRHALALDECRVKFLPEYVRGGDTIATDEPENDHTYPHAKEVWFAGTHSDVGGNTSESENPPPLVWMVMEAIQMGLRTVEPFDPAKHGYSNRPTRSLKGFWLLLELFPIKRLAYRSKKPTGTKRCPLLPIKRLACRSKKPTETKRWPHLGGGRKVLNGQKIHASVIDLKGTGYTSSARIADSKKVSVWEYLQSSQDPKVESSQATNQLPKVEPWGVVAEVTAYKRASEHQNQRDFLDKLHKSARSETGKHALHQAGVFDALKTLPNSHNGSVYLEDLHKIRDIFDEVYDGHIPEKLEYANVQSLLSHILAHKPGREFDIAHRFLVNFTNLTPVVVCVFHKHPKHRSSVVFASFLRYNGSECVISASEDGRVRIWNVETHRKATGFMQDESIKSFACSSDGQYAVSTSHSGRIYLWDIKEGKRLWDGSCPTGSLGSVDFNTLDELIVSAIKDSRLLIWTAKPDDLKGNGALQAQPLELTREHDISAETGVLLHSSHLRLWGANRRGLVSALFEDKLGGIATCVAVRQDGRLAAFGRRDRFINIYRWDDSEVEHSSFRPLATLLEDRSSKSSKGPQGLIKTLAFSPDGKHLIAGGYDNTIRIWDTEKWHEKIAFKEHGDDVNAVAISDDNQRIVSCSDDGAVHVWDAKALLTGPNLHDHEHSSQCPALTNS